ncbi:hypothetical protein JMA_04170 [Jeotgalibacillus malaysiensis]|uniref:DUF4440 domain-containing protein n=1 Tax=Jeotgalibacillus malaysiensis TaxID=1508404 RepID=A0A0B5ANX1_9BACL|nr:DUF4440 domain-containing protein [Jeotgalibacillus malaysiensis]AJD89734.1 hypothetical protein JMA_04170 [Jeotgalibacillus malaysiensis]
MDHLKSEILFHEKELLDNTKRLSLKDLDRLIHEDFLEFGKSGGTFRKSDLMTEGGAGTIEVEVLGFDVRPLSEDTVQAIYQSRNQVSGEVANRCSIWKRERVGWQMIFHQGTVAAGR